MDAITKLKMLGKGGEEDLQVTVTIDKKKGEIRVSDNGIGMTAEEVDQFINQVAFSSAEAFLKNYRGGRRRHHRPLWPAFTRLYGIKHGDH